MRRGGLTGIEVVEGTTLGLMPSSPLACTGVLVLVSSLLEAMVITVDKTKGIVSVGCVAVVFVAACLLLMALLCFVRVCTVPRKR